MANKKSVCSLLLSLVLLLAGWGGVAAEEDQPGNLELANEYISIFVNQQEYNQGRFAVDVTGGAPMRDTDDDKPLIYGRPRPWTSYTTLRIDGTNYVFGGPTSKRAGKNAQYGEVIQPPELKGDKIVTTTKFGSIIVTQILSFIESSTTGLPDTAKIKYRVMNQGGKPSKIGLRVMLDTLLGANDGAPFRIKNKAVVGDALYVKKELPTFFQAFDDLNAPQVTAQGTIKGPGISTPDKLYFADWGSLADGAWDFDFNPGEEFLRKGEFELDSAMALYWNPSPLKAGETREYVAHYGLGGITIVPGLLSLGITSPSEVVMDSVDKTAQVVAYIQNTADIKVKEAEVALELPENLELVTGEQVKKLGNLEPKETSQVMWEVRPTKRVNHQLEYTVKVNASNTDANQVTRPLKVVGPPSLSLQIESPPKIELKDNHLAADSLQVVSKITNHGNSTAYGVNAYLALAPGLNIKPGEKQQKQLGSLLPGESVAVPWHITPLGMVDGSLLYSIGVRSRNAGSRVREKAVVVPPRQPQATIEIKDKEDGFEVGDYLTAQVKVENIASFYQAQGSIKYNSEVLEPVYVSRGQLFVIDKNLLSWNPPVIDTDQKLIKKISGSLDSHADVQEGVVANLHFRVKAPGKVNLKFNEFEIDSGKRPNLFSIQLKGNNSYIGGN